MLIKDSVPKKVSSERSRRTNPLVRLRAVAVEVLGVYRLGPLAGTMLALLRSTFVVEVALKEALPLH